MQLRRLGPPDVDAVLDAAAVFDRAPTKPLTAAFLGEPGNHLIVAYAGQDAVGFVSGIEIRHPDKQAEMMLFELGVLEEHRRRGIGTGLVRELARAARERGCVGMWAPTNSDNVAAMATYRAAGAEQAESGVIVSWTF